ncbi:MAG TPA: hypothetical protein VMF30_19045 [Pirellulales bacterium]|nr:hypothetical protein [Pirellulales bacterium]
MKTERRHELETNQLAHSLAHWVDAVRPFLNTILVLILAALVAIGIYTVAKSRSATANASAWNEYFAALGRIDGSTRLKLEDLGEAHGGTPVGWWALCTAADLGLNEATNQLFRDKMLAQDILRSAADHYQTVLGQTSDPTLIKRASFGLAQAHECLGQITHAEEEYEAIVNKWPGTPVAKAAEKRAKDLKRPETRQFYDWFAKQDIGKRITPGSNQPGLKSPFNLNMLPDMPEGSSTPPADGAAPGSADASDPLKGLTVTVTPGDKPASDATPAEPSATEPAATEPTATAPTATGSAPAGKNAPESK